MCFDKTGTLTEDGLDVLGVRVVDQGQFTNMFESAVSLFRAAQSSRKSNFAAILHTMATCHSLRAVDGDLVGDPLDLKMVEFSGWGFEEGKQSPTDLDEDEQGGLSPSVARPPLEYTEMLHEHQGTDCENVRSSIDPFPAPAHK